MLILLFVTFILKSVRRNADWRSRESLLRSGLLVLPHNAKFHYNYGNLQRERSNHLEAMLHYYEAIRLWPAYPSARNNLAAVLVQQDRQDEAEQELQKVLQHYPAHQNAAFNLAQLYRNKKRFEESQNIIHNALKVPVEFRDRNIDQKLRDLLHSLSLERSALSLEKSVVSLEKSVVSLERSVQQDSLEPVHLEQQFDGAQVMANVSTEVPGAPVQILLLPCWNSTIQVSTSSSFSSAAVCHQLDEYSMTYSEMTKFQQICSECFIKDPLIIKTYLLQRSKCDQRKRLFTPLPKMPHRIANDFYTNTKIYDKDEKEIEINEVPSGKTAQALLQEWNDNTFHTVELTKTMFNLYRSNLAQALPADTGVAVAGTLLQLGWLAEAEVVLKQLLEVHHGHLAATVHLAQVYLQLRRYSSSESLLRSVLHTAPRHRPALYQLSLLRLALNQTEAAVAAARDAARGCWRPVETCALLHAHLADMLHEDSRVDAAILSYQKAILLKPSLARAHVNVGALYHTQGSYQEAWSHYLKAYTVEPSNPLLQENMEKLKRISDIPFVS